MAFSLGNLAWNDYVASESRIGTIWDYSTGDNMATVDGGTYFNTSDATKATRKGDWIRVTASDGKAIYVVSGATPTTPEVVLDKQATVSAFV